MKKHLLFDYGCTLLVFLLATFPTRRSVSVSSALFPNYHFTAVVALAEGVSEGNIGSTKSSGKPHLAITTNSSGLPLD